MGFLKKHRLEIFLWIVISFFYFVLRFRNLLVMPIFTDEAIYTRWAQIALNDASWRFISLTDGKQPLFVWFAMVFMKFFEDPLFAARLVSVVSGFFTMIGLWFVSFELFKDKRIAFLTALLYISYPFAQIYDRMALMDSMVATFSVWAFHFSVLLVRKVRLDVAFSLGIAMGLGALTKSSNFFSMYLLPFTLILFNFVKKGFWNRIFKWFLLVIFAVVIVQAMYSVLRLSPFFQTIEVKNATFVYPFSEWLTHPFTFFMGNIRGLADWLFGYLKLPYILLIAFSLVLIKHYPKEKILLLIYFLIPFVALALFGKVIFPRFIFFMSLYLLPLAGWSLFYLLNLINKTKLNKAFKYLFFFIVILVFVGYSLLTSFQLTIDPKTADIPRADRNQYISSWSAGWGVNKTVEFLEKKSKEGKVFVATEGTFGLMPASLELYLNKNKNVIIKGYWPINENLPEEAIEYAKKMPSYFVFYQPEHVQIPPDYPLELEFQEQEGNSDFYYRFYRIIP